MRVARFIGPICLLSGMSATAAGQAVMQVSDVGSHGTIGDAALSLNEAIELANGDISINILSNAERAFITGTPGAGVSDAIHFSFQTFPGTITAERELTEFHAGTDVIDVITAGYQVGDIVYDGAGAYGGIRVSSVQTKVIGLEVRNCASQCILVSALAGGDTSSAAILDCTLKSSGYGIVVRGPAAGNADVGKSNAPVLIERTTISDIGVLGNDSRGIVVTGGTGDDNEVHVQVFQLSANSVGGGALEVRGADTDGSGTGERNQVHVTVRSSVFQRNSITRSGSGVRLFGAQSTAASAADNHAALHLERVTVQTFQGYGVLVDSSAGLRNELELHSVLCTFAGCKNGGIALHAKEGNSAQLMGRLVVSRFNALAGPAVQVLASGGGTSQSVDLSAIGCWMRDGAQQGLHVRAEKNVTLTGFVSDNFFERNTLEGIRVEPLSAAGTLSYEIQRNTFRGNKEGVLVASGSSVTYKVDLGGGPLGSRGGNTFAGQTGCGVSNNNMVVVSAVQNDWGDASGPSDCGAGNSDGIPDPTGNGDGVSEYVQWSPFVAHDQNPELVITGSFEPPLPITLLVEDGVHNATFLLWAGLSFLDPPADGNLGNHWYLGTPFVRVIKGKVGTPLGPFNPPPELAGLEVELAAGVLQAGTFEMTNVFPLR